MEAVLPADSYTGGVHRRRSPGLRSISRRRRLRGPGRPLRLRRVLDVMVGVNTDGTCSGVSIISHSETSGLGANATKEDFRNQFVGKSNVAVTKDGGEIAALTGATITSRAVCDGVNAAIGAAASMG